MGKPVKEQEHYDNLFETFGTPGWRWIIDEATRSIYELQAAALEAPSWEVVCELRGQAEQLTRLVNLEAMTEMLYEGAKESAEDED